MRQIMKFSVLSSGSTGNAIYIETEENRIVVDVGMNGKKMDALFKMIDRDPATIDAILISHEHRDHVSGAGVFARKYGIPVYANAKTWTGMKSIIGELSTDYKFEFPTGSIQSFGKLDIESFGVSHDAREPMFFSFHYQGKKLSIVTDTGYISDKVKGVIDNSNAFVFECNHDVNLLRMGKYPWHLQQRILGDRGHVSNEDAALAMSEVIGVQTKRIYMAHLSKENNYVDLARMTVEQVLKGRECPVGQQFFIYETFPDKPTAMASV